MRKIGLAVLLAVAPLGAASAQVVPCSFSGSGATGVDCLGQQWVVGNGGWGIPGILLGTRPFLGTSPTTEFHIAFIAGGSFNGLIGFGPGFDTRMFDAPFTTPWTVSGSGTSVSFFAPAGGSLTTGEDFFVNVEFLNGLPQNLADVSFTARWGPAAPTDVVPEPATMMLVATGLAGLAGARRRRRA